MFAVRICILFCFASVIFGQGLDSYLPADFGLTVKQLIEKHGYPFEKHTVTTEDGYILEVHRIPHRRNQTKENLGSPVLISHGAASSSADYVNMGPTRSLGFILADYGYDVWLANCRGNTWSRRHTKLNPDADKKEFWDFSIQEVGAYDIPALIDYILEATKNRKLFYIGHSQGSAGFFILTSEKPEYNQKVRLMAALGPAIYFEHTKTFIVPFLNIFKKPVQTFIDRFQFYETLEHISVYEILGAVFCNNLSPFQDICAAVFFLFAGFSPQQFDKTLIPVYATNAPAGTSAKNWQHLAQLQVSKNFQKYDYGKTKNMKIYGQPRPPIYNITQVTAPVALFLGDRDVFIAKQDLDRAASEMKNVVHYKYIPGFNHLDVIWGIDAPELIFKDILKLMKQH